MVLALLADFPFYENSFLASGTDSANGIKDIAYVRIMYFGVVMAKYYFEQNLSSESQKITKIIQKFASKGANPQLLEKLIAHVASRVKTS